MAGTSTEKILRDSLKEGLVTKWAAIDLALMRLVDLSHGEKLMNSACLHRAECRTNSYLAVSRHFIFTSRRFGDSDETNILLWRWTQPFGPLLRLLQQLLTCNNTEEFFSKKTDGTTSFWGTQEAMNPFLYGVILQSSIIVVVFGNVLVLVALLCYRNWTSADVLIFSLSLADVLDSIVAVQLITTAKYYMRKHMAKSLCNAFIGLVYTFRVASATTVTVIAVERAILLTQPFTHHTLVTPSRIRKFVLGIWLFSVFSAILPFIGVGHSGFRDGECFSQLYDLGKAYAIYIEVFGAIQLVVVLVSYFAIKLSGMMFIRRQTIMSGHDGNNLRGNRESAQVPSNTSGVRNVKKLTVMMGIVVLFYYISWLPFLVSHTQRWIGKKIALV